MSTFILVKDNVDEGGTDGNLTVDGGQWQGCNGISSLGSSSFHSGLCLLVLVQHPVDKLEIAVTLMDNLTTTVDFIKIIVSHQTHIKESILLK